MARRNRPTPESTSPKSGGFAFRRCTAAIGSRVTLIVHCRDRSGPLCTRDLRNHSASHQQRIDPCSPRAKFLRLSRPSPCTPHACPEFRAAPENGVVRVKSAYGFNETIERLKTDIRRKRHPASSAKSISRKLAADAGIKLHPSTLLVFGNPPLGTQFMTSNPNAGLDWPVRLLVIQDKAGAVWTVYTDFCLDRRASRHRQPHRTIQDGLDGDRVDHLEREVEVTAQV